MFSTLIIQPILNIVVGVYNTIGVEDIGISILIMTVLVRTLLLPFSLRAARAQKAMADLAPDIERIKKEYAHDTSAQSTKVMALYRERGVNPLNGCLPLLLQLPIVIGMYQVFLNIFKPESLDRLYSFVSRPDMINPLFFGLFDISQPSHILAVTAGATQYIHSRMLTTGQSSPQGAIHKQMTFLIPIVIIVAAWSLPAGLAIYWIATTLFSIGEQLLVRRKS